MEHTDLILISTPGDTRPRHTLVSLPMWTKIGSYLYIHAQA
ncbi:hypothetical protein F383_11010 [Gossypium arboreum]|uniref:Uncharacterized protein n=1 Tax=Gossypium arboreum TaxID=29729 RepID=A0A0B0PRT1_GOSAR|nr:hypothetical protein F383_11010 [Gossypium arboreum]